MTVSYQGYAAYICNNDGTDTALNPVTCINSSTIYSIYVCLECLERFCVHMYAHCSMLSAIFSVNILTVCTVCTCGIERTCIHVHTLLCTVQYIEKVLLPETIAMTTESDRAWNRSQHSIYSTLHWLMIPICLVPVFLHFIYTRTECMYVCMRCSHVFIALYSCNCQCVHLRTCT